MSKRFFTQDAGKGLAAFSALTIFAALCPANPADPANPPAAISVPEAVAWPPPEAVRLAAIAQRNNPALAAAHLDAEAAHAMGHHHRAWEPPEIAAEFFNAPVSSFPNPLKHQAQMNYSVSQWIPFPGKLRTMAEPEHLRGAASEQHAVAVGRALRRDVFAAWAEAHAAAWMLRLARMDREIMVAWIQDARAGYAGGAGASTAGLRAERETARLDAEILRREARRRGTLARLHALLGGGEGASAVVVEPDTLESPAASAVFAASATDAVSGALQRRPDVEAIRREQAVAEADIAAARTGLLPDFMVRGMYKDMRRGPEDAWSLMVGMQVPLAPWSLGGVRQAERGARARRDRADRGLAAARLAVTAEVETSRAEWEAAAGRVVLAREQSVPLTDKILAAVRTEYASGAADFADVVAALRDARLAREEFHRAEADCLIAWARLEWAAGGG